MKIQLGKLLLLIVLMFAGGCSFVTVDYSDLNTVDGVNSYEAVLLAQKEILVTSFRHSRKVDEPDVLSGSEAEKHHDYWFIVFSPKISLIKAVQAYLVVVEKQTGAVVYKGIWDTQEHPGLDWVFSSEGQE